jgi:flagellar biosynthesis chaperone FliJ
MRWFAGFSRSGLIRRLGLLGWAQPIFGLLGGAILAALAAAGPAHAQDPRPGAATYAAETQTALTQLIGAADLFRGGRVDEAQAKLRSMRASLEKLADLADRFRELANREHVRCMDRITDLERRTTELFQQQEQIFAQITALDVEIASAAASANVANAQIAELNTKIQSTVADLEQREQKLKELQSWWWVPGYGQYLGTRTLIDGDVASYESLAGTLRDAGQRLGDSQAAAAAANALRANLQSSRNATLPALNDLKRMRVDAEGELGELKHSAVVLTDASVLWAKARSLLTITAADQLDSLESIQQLLERPSNAPEFDDPSREYAGDLQATLVRFAQSVDNGSNFLLQSASFCGGPPLSSNVGRVSQPCDQIKQITRYYEIVDPVTCSFRYANPPGCPPFPRDATIDTGRVAAARASGGWTRAPGQNWIAANRCRATAAIYYGKLDGDAACEQACMSDPECRFWTYNERNAVMPNSRGECWGGRGSAAAQRTDWGGFASGGQR